jgi:hypothetical protein
VKRLALIVATAAAYLLVAAVWLWFWPLMLQMYMDGTWDRYELQRRNNEYWFRRHGFNQWERQQEQQRRKRLKKKWKNRNNFYK